MRARFVLGTIGCIAVSLAAPWACIPHPPDDFGDYQERIASFPKQIIEASTFEGSAPTEGIEGLYYGACLSELGFGQLGKVFNFYTLTKYTPDPSGAKLRLSIQPLAVVGGLPPPTISKAGTVGDVIPTPDAPVAADGKFSLELGVVAFPGTANPVTGSDVLIERTTLKGLFGKEKFCARLGGEVKKPAAAARILKEPENICQFVPIKDGDPTPTFTSADFQPESCPL